jgi:DNA-binding NtrC family response regulator
MMPALESVWLNRQDGRARMGLDGRPAGDDQAPGEAGFAGLIGRHPSMRSIYQLVRRVAPTSTTVLITGESGTGKELVAQAIHALSPRRGQRLIPVHCGAIPEDLLESEMFGHEKGSFTDAVSARVGRFRLADGGTIFLDEVGDMSPKLQVKLLRVLEDGKFETVGGVTTQAVNVRVIAATNRNLEEAVAAGRFREDLFYRLRVVPVEMPPLRERREDIPLLVDGFLTQLHVAKGLPRFRITEDALAVLQAHSWPGNVRELRNLLEHLVVLGSEDGLIRREDLPPELTQAQGASALASWVSPPWDFDSQGIDFNRAIASIEDRLIARALELSGGNKKEAARLLSLNRTTLIEKLRRKREGKPSRPTAVAAAGAFAVPEGIEPSIEGYLHSAV